MSSPKVVVIGLDGVTWQLLDPLFEEGIMPNLKKVAQEGARGTIISTLPPFTYVAWKGYATGKNPGQLGVYYWHDLAELRQGRVKINDSTSFRGLEIWDHLEAQGLRCGVLNMPMTYPPKKLSGFMVSGMPAFEHMSYTYPPELKEKLSRRGHRIHTQGRLRLDPGTDKEKALSSRLACIEEMKAIEEVNIRLAQDLLKRDLDFLHLTIFYTDQMVHYLWKPLVEGDQGLQKAIRGFWQNIDASLGELLSQLGDDCHVFVLSDHGQSLLRAYFHTNNWLMEQGYLKIRGQSAPHRVANWLGLTRENAFKLGRSLPGRLLISMMPQRLLAKVWFFLPKEGGILGSQEMVKRTVWSHSKALMVGDGLIFINLPRGSAQYEEFREELAAQLREVKDPETGQAIMQVAKPEEVYGTEVEDFDLLAWANPSYAVWYSPKERGHLWTRDFPDGYSACHDVEAIFMARGPGIKRGRMETASIYDIAPTILHILGLPIPQGLAGRVMHHIFEKESPPALREARYEDAERIHVAQRIRDLKRRGKI